MNSKSVIVAHGGIFHADDAMAVAILLRVMPGAEVFRGNPGQVMGKTEGHIISVDVGGKYLPADLQFDHHQRGGAGSRPDGTPFAAAGLIFRHFMEGCVGSGSEDLEAGCRVDSILIKGIDAADCGKSPRPPEGAPPSISQCVAWLNPGTGATDCERRDAFMEAVGICDRILTGAIEAARAWVRAKWAVRNAVTSIPQDSQRTTLVLKEFVPWDEHIFTRSDQASLLYVIFPSERGGYMLQQVPKEPGSFEGRKPLPAEWAGLRGEELAKETGVSDATFCHPGRFCGGAESLEGTLDLARLAVEHAAPVKSAAAQMGAVCIIH